MLFSVFLAFFGASKELFFNSTALEDGKCEDITGCNLNALNTSLEIGDKVVILDSLLSGEIAKSFLSVVNGSLYKNITLTGSATVISDPGYEPSEKPALLIENATFAMSNISFEMFKLPILNAVNASVTLSSTTFASSDCTRSALVAFFNSTLTGSLVKIANNTANTQSLLVGMHSNMTISNLELSTNFMESKDIRAAVHLLESNLTITDSSFLSNTMKLPLLASSNTSSLSVYSTVFQYNKVLCVAAMEFDAVMTIHDCKFRNCNGALIAGGQNSTCNFSSNTIDFHRTDEILIGLTDSNVVVSKCKFTNSTVSGLVFTNIVNETVSYNTLIQETYIKDMSTSMPLFAAIGGNLNVRDVKAKSITSSSEIIVYSHQNANTSSLVSSKFTKIRSTSAVSAGISTMNVTSSLMDTVKFSKNTACGCLFENTSVIVKKSNFSFNQCFPQGNSIPIAILTTTFTEDVYVEDSVFWNNTALTGSLFLMNVTGTVKNTSFRGNNAVQGAAIFGASMNVTVDDTDFSENSAMALGGAVSLTAGNATFRNCNFTQNSAPEGAAISAKDNWNINVIGGRIRRNNGTNATFINAEGEDMLLLVRDVEVDDDFSKAVWIDKPEKADFTGSKFNCKMRCQPVGKITPRVAAAAENTPEAAPEKPPEPTDDPDEIPEEETQESGSLRVIWILFPFSFLVAVVVYNKVGKGKLFRLCRGKGKHLL